MSDLSLGILVIAGLGLLLTLGVPIGVSLLFIGLAGWVAAKGFSTGVTVLSGVPFTTAANYGLTLIPLFIIMGSFAFFSGIAGSTFDSAAKWLGRLRGGLAIATTAACSAFAAMCGSSVAATATMGKICFPEMKRYNYDDKMATGCVAASGPLAIMIPPSGALVLYGVITDVSIGKLLIAGILPGLMMAVSYMVVIWIWCHINPNLAPSSPEKIPLRDKIYSLKGVWGVPLLIFVVMGGIYTGIMTPTEAASGGALVTLIIFIVSGRFNFRKLYISLLDAGKTTCMLMLIVIGAFVFGSFIAYAGIPMVMAEFITKSLVSPYLALTGFYVMYLVLGCLLDGMAMIVITLPIVFPVVTALGFDPVWFGVLIVMMMEIGMLTPPVGMAVFVVKGVVPDVEMVSIFKGIIPFLIADLILVVIWTIFPAIVLFLPSKMF